MLRLGSLATCCLPDPLAVDFPPALVEVVVDPWVVDVLDGLDVVLSPWVVVVVPCAVVVVTGWVVVVAGWVVVVVVGGARVVVVGLGVDVVVVAPTAPAVAMSTAIAARAPALARRTPRWTGRSTPSPTGTRAPGMDPVAGGRSVMWLEHDDGDSASAAGTRMMVRCDRYALPQSAWTSCQAELLGWRATYHGRCPYPQSHHHLGPPARAKRADRAPVHLGRSLGTS